MNLSSFPHSLSIPLLLSISSFSLHFLFLTPFPHSLSISSSFSYSLSIFSHFGCKDAASCAILVRIHNHQKNTPCCKTKSSIFNIFEEKQSIPNLAVETNRRVRSVWSGSIPAVTEAPARPLTLVSAQQQQKC